MAVLAALSLAGCASVSGSEPAESVRGPAARGAEVARLHCAGCHAIGATGYSPQLMAPPFRLLRNRYNEISFERRLERLADDHSEMPRFTLSRSDIDSVAAYMESLPR